MVDNTLRLSFAGACMVAMLPSAAYASTNAAGPTTDIIVTALKRSASLQTVPAAVSVVDNERLTDLGVSNLVQIKNLSTGLDIAPIRSRANVFIRGVGQSLASPNADANVALNLNGVYLPAQLAGTAFFDVDRVEILSGPQGTLYGRNSTGGVINITSRMPGVQLAVDGFVEIGNFDHVQGMVGLDIPISDTLFSRTAATHNRHDGYFENGEDDQKTSALRQTLVWEPSAATKISLVGTYTHEGGIGNVLMNVPGLECGRRCASFDPRALGYFTRINVFEGSVTLEQKLGENATLTYIGGYSNLEQDVLNALFTGPPAVPFQNAENTEVQSHELRLNARAGKLEGIVGAYYFDEEGSVDGFLQANPVTRVLSPFDARSHGRAIYGQATYSIGESFRVTGGIRYSRNIKKISGRNAALNAAGVALFDRPYEGRVAMDRVDWKTGVEFDLGPGSMLYVNVASGFTPGGLSTGPRVLGQLPAASFKPVTLIAYSGGVKNRFADGILTFNFEGFYYDYKNYQVSARDLATLQNLVYNAEKSTVYGVQLDAKLTPSRNDDLSLSATYLHAQADTLVTPSGSFNGFDLPFSPHWTINAFHQHAFDVGNSGAQIRANVNFKYTSGRWTIYSHGARGLYQKGNTHTDLNLGYFTADDRWSIQLYVRNLEDKLVKTACVNSAVPGPAACYFEPPRTYGVLVGFKF